MSLVVIEFDNFNTADCCNSSRAADDDDDDDLRPASDPREKLDATLTAVHLRTMRFHGRSLFFALVALLTCSQRSGAAEWDVTSPSGQVRLIVTLGRSPFGSAKAGESDLSFRVEHGRPGAATVVIGESPLGLQLDDADLGHRLRLVSAQDPVLVEESYTMPHGKRARCYNAANCRTLRFQNRNGQTLELDLRAFNDGVAFRYRVPGPSGTLHALRQEDTGFQLPRDARLWMAPADKPGTYSPAYETYYENGAAIGKASPNGLGWSFPALYCTGDQKHWALITEANLGTNYFGGRLGDPTPDGLYPIRMPSPAEGHGYGATEPFSELPWETPWRVVMVGDSPGVFVESTLVDDLAAPSRLTDTSWIQPGRVAWSWWSDQSSPKDATKQMRFIDFAAEMGWEDVLVDANWTIMERGNIHDVLQHAKEKGVGVLLWYNSGGANNVVTEKPRGTLFYPEVRRFELKMLHDWGVKGIKVDFFQSDKPDVIALYQSLLQDAAQEHIMVNFHGCTVPRGWERTYPNLMSTEAVRGEECYLFDEAYSERAPVQNAILPFTRNVVGPMDYTPMGLSRSHYPRLTTAAHELALTALFETGWLHFADDPDVYRQLPAEPKDFIRNLPVAWDDTRFVSGYPGRYVVIARRHGRTWYLAGVNGESEPHAMKLDLQRILGSGTYRLTLIADGTDARHFASQTGDLKSTEPLSVKVLSRGGFVATLQREQQ